MEFKELDDTWFAIEMYEVPSPFESDEHKKGQLEWHLWGATPVGVTLHYTFHRGEGDYCDGYAFIPMTNIIGMHTFTFSQRYPPREKPK